MITNAEDERYARAVEKALAAKELFERAPRFKTLEEIEAALQEGIYGLGK